MAKINRKAVVEQYSPVNTVWDAYSPFSVGNGEFAFNADMTGLQTFSRFHEPGIPLLTQAQWGWHTTPYKKDQDGSDAVFEWKAGCSLCHKARISEDRIRLAASEPP